MHDVWTGRPHPRGASSLPAGATHGSPGTEPIAGAAAPPPMLKTAPERRSRRAGVLLPLFSMRRRGSWGVGEIDDMVAAAAWAAKAGFSVLQLLPVNAVGHDVSPYAAVSAFALDPVYLSLDSCEDFVKAGGRDALSAATRGEIAALTASDFVLWNRVRTVKREGARLAFERFFRDEWQPRTGRARELGEFIENNRAWLDDYALYVVLHDRHRKAWSDWPLDVQSRAPDAIGELRRESAETLLKTAWVQWQLDVQWSKARREANRLGVELMGDLPFTVAMDSADVWANRAIFRTDLHVGTPPDDSSPAGQDWGLPVYDWDALRQSNFAWLRARAARAGQLFGIYRVDHVIGFYRTFFRSSDGSTNGFSPDDEAAQIRLGESIMRLMRHFGEIVAEDLGAVPPFLRPSLEQLGVPGYRVLRWEKDGAEYRDPAGWPVMSVATTSTHDTTTNAEWYESLSVDERAALGRIPDLRDIDPSAGFDDTVRDALLRAVYRAPSTLVLVTFQDAMGLWDRLNVPGTLADTNWTHRMPVDLDALASDEPSATRLLELAKEAERAPAAAEAPAAK